MVMQKEEQLDFNIFLTQTPPQTSLSSNWVIGVFGALWTTINLIGWIRNWPIFRFKGQMKILFGITSWQVICRLYRKHRCKIKVSLNNEMSLLRLLCLEEPIIKSLFDCANDHTKSEIKLLDTFEKLIIKCSTMDDERAICMTLIAISDGIFERGFNRYCALDFISRNIDFNRKCIKCTKGVKCNECIMLEECLPVNEIDGAFILYYEALGMCARHNKKTLAQQILLLLDPDTSHRLTLPTSLDEKRVRQKIQFMIDSKDGSHSLNTFLYKIAKSKLFYWELSRHLVLTHFESGLHMLRIYNESSISLPIHNNFDIEISNELDNAFNLFVESFAKTLRFERQDDVFIDFSIKYSKMIDLLIDERYQSEARTRIFIFHKYGIDALLQYESANISQLWTDSLHKKCNTLAFQKRLLGGFLYRMNSYAPRAIYGSSEVDCLVVLKWLKLVCTDGKLYTVEEILKESKEIE